MYVTFEYYVTIERLFQSVFVDAFVVSSLKLNTIHMNSDLEIVGGK